MKSIRVSLVVCLFSLLSFQQSIAAETYTSIPISICDSSQTDNCVEQLTATFPDGHIATASLTGRSSVAQCSNVSGISTQCNFYEWRVEGLKNEDGRDLIQTLGWIQPPTSPSNTTLPPGALLFFISDSGWDSKFQVITTGVCSNGNPLNLDCRTGFGLQLGVSWSVSIRAGKFQPAWTTGTLKNSRVTVAQTNSYNKITYTGEPAKTAGIIPNPNSDGSPPERNDFETSFWSIRSIDTNDPVATVVKNQNCGGLNPTMMTDALWVGLPVFSAADSSIQLSVRNPHLLSNGDQATGQFEGEFSEAFVKCFWNKSLNDAGNRVQLELTYGDGEKSIATLTSGVVNGSLKIIAAGYHYSSPIMKISLKKNQAVTPEPKSTLDASRKTSTKLPTITCVRGNITKKLSAAKCPSGYKKK